MSEDTKKYILTKEEGSMGNVQIINPSNGSVNIVGQVTFDMLHILKDTAGLTDADIPIPKAWVVTNLPASAAEQILQLAMRIKKPVRKTQKKKKQVNALDILLGRVKV